MFHKVHRKTLFLESLFIKIVGPRPATVLKRRLAKVLSCEFYETFKNTSGGSFCMLKISVPVAEFTSAVD